MAAMAPDGAAQAINLTGLTLKGEMDMALRIGQYRSATLCHHLMLCLLLAQKMSQHPGLYDQVSNILLTSDSTGKLSYEEQSDIVLVLPAAVAVCDLHITA